MKIALIGYGKMGKAIEEIAIEKKHTIELKINSKNPGELTLRNLRKCDVAIEFTNPHSAVQNLFTCFDAGIPVVCGSTGWLSQFKEVERKCLECSGALLYASNFSIGVNIFFEINALLAKHMNSRSEYDVKVEEIHHTHKKDAPSGTAITIAEQILDAVTRKTRWVNEETNQPSDLYIESKRIDPAPGTHTVTYHSPVDDISIIHTAHNRTGFAAGAVMAASFLKGKTGIYNMKDVLGL